MNQMDSQDASYFDGEDDEEVIYPSIEKEDFEYKFVEVERIVDDMYAAIREVQAVARLPTTVTRVLMNHHKWDKEKLLEKLYSPAGDVAQTALFESANLVDPRTFKFELPPEEETTACPICMDSDLTTNERHYMDHCRHWFCIKCFTHYLKSKITDEGEIDTIHCATFKCPILVDDDVVMSCIFDDTLVLQKYKRFMANRFVQANRLMRWCPKADCNRAVLVNRVDSLPIKCECKSVFCFRCGEKWHQPVKCDTLIKWKTEREGEDFQTLDWINKNAKDCPSCARPIEKNGGCNHMHCTKCNFSFCWVCLKSMAGHNSCNLFVKPDVIGSLKQENFQKYVHHLERFLNHEKSYELEGNLYDKVDHQGKEIMLINSGLADNQIGFLEKAVDVLRTCRLILAHSYVFAFYHKNSDLKLESEGNQLEIYLVNQRNLEAATESLSEELEKDMTLQAFPEMKQRVVNKYEYCDTRRKVLLEHVKEGEDKEWWQMLVIDFKPLLQTFPGSQL